MRVYVSGYLFDITAMSVTRRAKNECHYVYVMDTPGLLTKVGLTQSPPHRLADVNMHNPFGALVWHTACLSRQQAFQIEACVHRSLESYAAHGEWLYVDTDTAILTIAKCSYKIGV